MGSSLVSDLTVRMAADTSNLLSGVGSASGALQNLVGSVGRMSPAAGVIAGVATAAIGFGAASVKMAGDFQQGITTLATGAGESQSNLKMVSDGILNLATSTGTSTKQLTSGMFMIESSGQRGSQALLTLKAAAEGAKVGQADLGTVADATTTIMTDFSSKNVTAAQAVNTLIATVSSGKTNMQALSSSLSGILPTASAAGIGLTDTSAAMATITGEGVPAAQASTYLRQMIMGLEAPSTQTKTALAGIGLSSKQVSDEMKVSLPGALQLITDHLAKKFPPGSAAYVNALKDISGGSKNMQGILDLTGSHLQTFKDNVTNIAGAVKQGGDSINNWSTVQGNFNFKMDQAKEALETFGIKVGTALLPVMSNLVGLVAPAITGFTGLMSATSPLAPIFNNIAGMVRIMGANWQQASGSFAPLMSTLGQFGSLVGQLLPGFISFFLIMLNNANMIIVSLAQAFATIGVPAIKIFGQVLQGAQQFLNPIINAVSNALVPAIQNLIGAIAPLIAQLLSWIANSGMIVPIMAFLGNAISFVVGIVATFINGLVSVVTWLTHTEVGLDILKGVMILVGAIMGYVILAIVVQFGIMAVAAVTAAITTIIAWLPVILIVLAIIAVIALVILIIQHWGQIVAWLQGVWSVVAAFFVSLWSGIVAFFVGLWARIVTAFQTAWNGIVTFFQGIWNSIIAFLQAAWNTIVNVVKAAAMVLLAVIIGPIGLIVIFIIQHWNQILAFFSAVWNAIVAIAVSVWNSIIAVIAGAFNTIAGWFSWLYNHNYYFQALCDFIRNVINNVVTWLTTTWNNIVTWIQTQWALLQAYATLYWMMIQIEIQNAVNQVVSWLQGIWNSIVTWISTEWAMLQAYANLYWTMIQVEIQAKVQQVVSWLQGIWNSIVSWISSQWARLSATASAIWAAINAVIQNVVNQVVSWLQARWSTLSQLAQNAWNAVTGVFRNAWSGLSSALSGIWNGISNWFSNLTSQALTWGKNVIQGFIDGINNMLGAVGNAASGVVDTVKKFLGFHSPAKEGPGRDADVWAPNLMKMYAAGIMGGTSSVRTAALSVVNELGVLNGSSSYQYTGRSNTLAMAADVAANGSASSSGEQHIHVHIGNSEIAEYVTNEQMKMVRLGGYRR